MNAAVTSGLSNANVAAAGFYRLFSRRSSTRYDDDDDEFFDPKKPTTVDDDERTVGGIRVPVQFQAYFSNPGMIK